MSCVDEHSTHSPGVGPIVGIIDDSETTTVENHADEPHTFQSPSLTTHSVSSPTYLTYHSLIFTGSQIQRPRLRIFLLPNQIPPLRIEHYT